MTMYFDKVREEIRRTIVTSDIGTCAQKVADIEAYAICDVLLCVNDEEFPADLRTAIVLDIEHFRGTSPEGNAYAEIMHTSRLLPLLHEHFHELARRRLTFRFGLVDDSPEKFLKAREAWKKVQHERAS